MNIAGILRQRGYTDVNRLYSALVAHYRSEAGPGAHPSTAQLVDVLDRNPEIPERLQATREAWAEVNAIEVAWGLHPTRRNHG